MGNLNAYMQQSPLTRRRKLMLEMECNIILYYYKTMQAPKEIGLCLSGPQPKIHLPFYGPR
jgi:hypothetical protein